MMCRRMLKGSARSVCAVLAVGSLFAATGCDQLGGVLTMVRTTAEGAVRDKAASAIQDAVSGILGGVIPGAGGA